MTESSMDAIDAAAGAGEGLFLRKATGLVRDISMTDAFLFNAVGMNVGLGALFMLRRHRPSSLTGTWSSQPSSARY